MVDDAKPAPLSAEALDAAPFPTRFFLDTLAGDVPPFLRLPAVVDDDP